MNRNRFTYICLITCFSIILVVMGNRTTEANGGLDLKIASFFKGETSVGTNHKQTQGETRVRELSFQKDLGKMAAVFQAEDIMLQDWSFYAREQAAGIDVKEYANVLRKKFPDWRWTERTTSETWEMTAVSTASNHHSEKLQFLATRTKQPTTAYIVYSVRGNEWNEASKSFIMSSQFENRLNDIFRGKPTVFSCMKGVVSDKIDKALEKTASELMSGFQAKEIEALKEENFMSVSAMSPLFTDAIDLKNNNMNLQIGLRSEGLGGPTTVVVGTPIITIEY
ncbi:MULTISPECIES: YwmB family TATA-box binding protein [Neobacillus]|uniref:YwmB family TATA-box binding protein n=1 Tax=Neobacillus rhizophilus TaxID=2833579 RepID=A0A942U5A0_9BACI|nr:MULTISPECIES: YwmB family TATA-box binding protein [Neobacillus]MBS4212643.1 YwmB family TATA-box binding protein [Neobacillus rhizophilus]